MFFYHIIILILLTYVDSEGICPRNSEVPCAGTCNEAQPTTMNYDTAVKTCDAVNKKVYAGSLELESEDTCENVLPASFKYVWTRYKLVGGLVVTEEGQVVPADEGIPWKITYCAGLNQQGVFKVAACSWEKSALCVSNMIQYDKDNVISCGGEYYWISTRRDLKFDQAVTHCKQQNMELATPYTNTRRNCFSSTIKDRLTSTGRDAWINYNISAATRTVEPWEEDYCVKVNVENNFVLDLCTIKLDVICSSHGDVEVLNSVVQKGQPAQVSCKCSQCTTDQLEWTDGITIWRSGDNSGDINVRSIPTGNGVSSILTLSHTTIDKKYTCMLLTSYDQSIVYKTATIDVYDLRPSSHFIEHGERISLTCDFNNEKNRNLQRVEWIDMRNKFNYTTQARTTYKGTTIHSAVDVNSEIYTHDIRCTFHVGSSSYTGMVRVIVYGVEGKDVSVPANSNSSLTCELKERGGAEGRSDLIPPTRVDWIYMIHNYPSESSNPFKASLTRDMRTGTDVYTCKFTWENGDVISKTITVIAFDFQGIPSTVANGTRAEMFCSYQQGIQPTEPLWWEIGYPGVKVRDGQKRGGERYEVSGNFVNDDFYKASTKLTVHNSTDTMDYYCYLRVSGKVWSKKIPLVVYAGEFIGYNVTITERIDPETDQLQVGCAVWAYPQPDVTIMVDNKLIERVKLRVEITGNVTQVTYQFDRTCDAVQVRCAARNKVAPREVVMKTKLNKKCGFFAKITLKMWLIIGGVILALLIIMILICCCCCRKNRKLKEKVEYQREVLSQVDGVGSLYSMSTVPRAKLKNRQFEDMYDDGVVNAYDPLHNDPDDDGYNANDGYCEPFHPAAGAAGPLSPRYQSIDYDQQQAAPLFNSRSKSRENVLMMSPLDENSGLFSPKLKKSNATLSQGNLRSIPPSSPRSSRSQHNLDRKFSVPLEASYPRSGVEKMNPYGGLSRLPPSDLDDAPSVMGDHNEPPVAILSPHGWRKQQPDPLPSMMAPPHGPLSGWPMDPREKVNNWNMDPPSGLTSPRSRGPASTMGESTGKSTATLDTISITPTFLANKRDQKAMGKPLKLPSSVSHPEDRTAYASTSPPPSTIGPSVSQLHLNQPPRAAPPRGAGPVLDIDDLSSVDVPDQNGMDTLDRRVVRGNEPPHENYYTQEGPGAKKPKGGIQVLPSVPLRDRNLKTSNF